MAKSLLVVGSVAFDSVRTPHGKVEDVLGGSAVYFSVAASFFAPVRLVGVVGEDFPGAFRQVLEARRIDTAGLEVVEGGQTFRWRGSYEGAMNEARTDEVHLNVFGDFRPKLPEAYRDSSLVFLANGSPVTQMAVLAQVEKPDLVVADTMNLWIETARDALVELLGKVDGLVLNDAEARMLTGEANLIRAGEKILGMGPRFVVVKKGEHGALVLAHDGPRESIAEGRLVCPLPGFPCPVVRDPTGAGDSFAGGIMGYLAREGRQDFGALRRATAYGTVVASFTVEDFSLRRLERLRVEEIEGRMKQYGDMLRVE
ncbi:MAG: PfkB family carbohydrate kinase [Phycisphaerae bacterium]